MIFCFQQYFFIPLPCQWSFFIYLFGKKSEIIILNSQSLYKADLSTMNYGLNQLFALIPNSSCLLAKRTFCLISF